MKFNESLPSLQTWRESNIEIYCSNRDLHSEFQFEKFFSVTFQYWYTSRFSVEIQLGMIDSQTNKLLNESFHSNELGAFYGPRVFAYPWCRLLHEPENLSERCLIRNLNKRVVSCGFIFELVFMFIILK